MGAYRREVEASATPLYTHGGIGIQSLELVSALDFLASSASVWDDLASVEFLDLLGVNRETGPACIQRLIQCTDESLVHGADFPRQMVVDHAASCQAPLLKATGLGGDETGIRFAAMVPAVVSSVGKIQHYQNLLTSVVDSYAFDYTLREVFTHTPTRES